MVLCLQVHVTLLNSKYGSASDGHRQPFDATRLLTDFEQFDFGSQEVTEVQLSSMQGTGADGYYTCVHNLHL